MNNQSPNGFVPRSLTSWNKYYIPASDTNAYRVGDAIKSAGGTDAAGIIAVTLHPGTGPARGVIVAVDPGLPATGGLVGGVKASVPAIKTAPYYVWVLDDPNAQFAMVDDGLTPANSVAASAGKYANFTPGTGPAANGSSTAVITSSTLGSTSGSLQVLQLQPGSTYGAGTTWLVKFAQHELASGTSSTPTTTSAVPPPTTGVINSTNVATYSQLNAPPLSVPAGGVLTIDASAYPGMAAAITLQTGQGGTCTIAWSGGAVKENAAGTSAASVTLPACSVAVITQSPTGAGVFRLVGGASL